MNGPFCTILFNYQVDGVNYAICEDDDGGLWYGEIPEEYAEPGDVLEVEHNIPLIDFPDAQEREKIEKELAEMPVEYRNRLLDGYTLEED